MTRKAEGFSLAGSKYAVSEATVTKMLRLYDYDPNRTLDYFLKQKSGEYMKTEASIKTDVATVKTEQPQKPKTVAIKKEESIPTKGKSATLRSDLDAMGFKLDIKELSADEDLSITVEVDPAQQRRLTVVFAGHVDAGKSTLVGTLLRTYAANSREKSTATETPLAWLTDESVSEREHGVTIGIAEK